ncbi:hypothetical protein NDU88_004821 [Pleurodeles waltl]|uniref:Uncharacterized protein n=1 Tax=Pleurodeles waltl TaxID=8319 RepID=A0AAV7MUI9_PLEWA|nr:hypothetical protein NDU88_004821 [Pleurodeles waltl]
MRVISQLRTPRGDSLALNLQLHTSRGTHSTLRTIPTALALAVRRKIGAPTWSGRPALADSGYPRAASGASPGVAGGPARTGLQCTDAPHWAEEVRCCRGERIALPADCRRAWTCQADWGAPLGPYWLVCCRGGGGSGRGPPSCPGLLVTWAARGRAGGLRRGAGPRRRTRGGSGASGSEPWSVR